VPPDYLKIHSGLGEAPPRQIIVLPISFEGSAEGVLELASFDSFSPLHVAFLEELARSTGIVLDSIASRMRLAQLLAASQTMTEELQAQSEELQFQQEELRASNEELEEQTQALRQSEETLQAQQVELEKINTELQEKAQLLLQQNLEMDRTKQDLEEKAGQLEVSSRYKSEFLANMSHELRTPLNSLLILSKLLADNGEGNLTNKQVEFARTIYSSGQGLLALINDVLDLAKIESGKMSINPDNVRLQDIKSFVEQRFTPIAQQKHLEFHVSMNADLPHAIYSDAQRIEQVLQNLLSNAFKFTEHGTVALLVDGEPGPSPRIIFSVADTGIGIPQNKHAVIFAAFQQVDGTTSRKYGGTGLGLSVSRDIATLLGGDIAVTSNEGEGSTFTFTIPAHYSIHNPVAFALPISDPSVTPVHPHPPFHPSVSVSMVKMVLIVGDNTTQRNVLMDFIGHKRLVIAAGVTVAQAMNRLAMDHFDAVVLDGGGMPDDLGMSLLNTLNVQGALAELMVFLYTERDLTAQEERELAPYEELHVIRGDSSLKPLGEAMDRFLGEVHPTAMGAAPHSEVPLPAEFTGKKILLVDDDIRNTFALTSVLEPYGMEMVFAENGAECLAILETKAAID
jgi:two-component system chemotaxis sensor kinase CheA